MRLGFRSGLAVVALLATLGRADAQQNQADTTRIGQPQQHPGGEPPVSGANSFSEGQARRLIEAHGYNSVSALVNDRQGIWHGTASKGAARVHVFVDYKGHVSAKPE